jgi:hypothetical protein
MDAGTKGLNYLKNDTRPRFEVTESDGGLLIGTSNSGSCRGTRSSLRSARTTRWVRTLGRDPNDFVPEIGTDCFESSRSSIAVVTKHMFGLGKVKGSFDLADGELVVVEPVTGSTVVARATVGSFATGSKQRDKRVKSRTFLDSAGHPHIDSRSTGITRTSDGWLLAGPLTVRGKAAPVEFTPRAGR